MSNVYPLSFTPREDTKSKVNICRLCRLCRAKLLHQKTIALDMKSSDNILLLMIDVCYIISPCFVVKNIFCNILITHRASIVTLTPSKNNCTELDIH